MRRRKRRTRGGRGVIDGMAKVEVYEVDGEEPKGEQFVEVTPHLGDGDNKDWMLVLAFGGKRVSVSASELLAAVAAMKVISEAR
jgi:hypothetical protein